MPIINRLEGKGYEIGIWKVMEDLSELEGMYTCFSEEQIKYNTFKNERRKKEWLATRILLSELTQQRQMIRYNEDGAPLLNDQHISISHANGCVVVLLSKEFGVGIDIEDTRRRITPILPRFLSSEELKLLNDELIELGFYFWCAKEALFKLVPECDIDFREQMRLNSLVTNYKFGHITYYSKFKEPTNYRVEFMKLENYLLAWIVD